MKTILRRFALATVLASLTVPALADYTTRDGSGNIITVKSGIQGGAVLPQVFLTDAFGNAISSTNPIPMLPGSATMGGQVNLSATSTSSNISLPALPSSYPSITLYNAGPNEAFYAQGTASVQATTGSIKLPVGLPISVKADAGGYVAAVTASGQTASITIWQASGPVLSGGAGTSGGGGGGGGTSSLFNATFPSDGTAVGMAVGGNMVPFTGTGGNLNVQCANCSGSGVSATDQTVFSPGSSVFAPNGGFYQTTPTNNPLTNLQQGSVQLTANRAMFTNLRNAAGAEIGTVGVPVQVAGSVGITGTPTVTANAGTNLNTSALALETGGNLGSIQVGIGSPGATACATDTASCSQNQQLQRIAQRLSTLNTTLGSPLQTGGSVTISGTPTVNLGTIGAAATAANQTANYAPVAAGTATATASAVMGGQFDTTQKTVSNGQQAAFSMSPRGALYVAPGAEPWTVAPTAGAAWGIGATASAVPANSIYGGINVGGNLRGSTGLALGSTFSQTIAIVDASGNQITSFGSAANVGLTGATAPTSAGLASMVQGGNNVALTGTSGNLNVQCANCSGSGVSATDQTAFTAGSSTFAPGGGFYQTTATSNPLANGQQGAWQMTANRAGFVNLRNASGTEIGVAAAEVFVGGRGTLGTPGGGVLTVQGGVSMIPVLANPGTAANWGVVGIASTTTGTLGQLGMAASTTTAPSYTTGQNNPLSMTLTGDLRVADAAVVAAIQAGTVATGTFGAPATTTVLSVQGGPSMTPFLTNPGTASNWAIGPTGAAVVTNAQLVGMSQGGNLIAMTGTSGNLNVQCANCSGSGASAQDQASFTAGASLFAPGGGFFQTTATNNPLTNGQQGMWQMTATRAGFVNLRTAAGAEIGAANTAPLFATIAQGSNSAVVKAASTTPVATDPALVVSLSPNSAGLTPTGPLGTPSSTAITVQGGTNMFPLAVGGDVGAGVTDLGNPVKMGGVYSLTQPTLADGQRGNAQLSARSAVRVVPGVENFAVQASQSGTYTVQVGNTPNSVPILTRPNYAGALLSSVSLSFAGVGNNILITRAVGTIKVYRLTLACASPVVITFKDGTSTALTGAMTVNTVYLPSEDGEPHFTTTGTNNFVAELASGVQCSGRAYYLDN